MMAIHKHIYSWKKSHPKIRSSTCFRDSLCRKSKILQRAATKKKNGKCCNLKVSLKSQTNQGPIPLMPTLLPGSKVLDS